MMVTSKSSDSSSSKLRHGEDSSDTIRTLLDNKIKHLKFEIQAERAVFIRKKLKENRKKLRDDVSRILSLATSRNNVSETGASQKQNMLFLRTEKPLCQISGFSRGSGDKDSLNIQEVFCATSAKLPFIEKIPPYTTWIFLDRNQRMAEDQSVVGRRRIYYDPHGNEALICSDSEEETAEPSEVKRSFSDGEDRIIWMAFQEHGLGKEVIDIVSECIEGTASEILERYNILKEKNEGDTHKSFKACSENGSRKIFLGKSLSGFLDSFDNLFCRRCLVFDCRLHGCSQNLIYPSEKQTYSSESDDEGIPCSDQCYLKLKNIEDLPENSPDKALRTNQNTSSDEEVTILTSNTDITEEHHRIVGERPVLKHMNTMIENSLLISDNQGSSEKQKVMPNQSEVTTMPSEGIKTADSTQCNVSRLIEDIRCETENVDCVAKEHVTKESFNLRKRKGISSDNQWEPFEKELYLKGIEIFGRNSCLIARNLLSGLKTCIEVSNYMYDDGGAVGHGASEMLSSYSEDNKKAGADFVEREMPTRSRLFRKRGKTRKLKYSWKSAGHPSMWKRIADGKNPSCRQYTPCGCQSMCGKQCPCLHNGTCCEKYCGCSKSCKNRFRGCHCAKSQCRSRQCPCFAAGRECDPDVCRNCWVSCGDGSLGEPLKQGDGQCGNMRLLLRQQQRILLAKSDVAGWGAFLKNPVNKNDYLGEYTGELISHREADKRGKIYDRANSSFLFDLNDQYVLDAYRKGDKLKFANHSSNPNCYAKVMLVAGDHRVGIFAKEHIEASEELFYDYRYGPDQAPAWARRPEGSRGDDPSISQGRAKKHQSH